MIHEAERVLLTESEVLFQVNGTHWRLGVVTAYTDRRCNLIAHVHQYNPLSHSVMPGVKSWEVDLFWCLRGHEPERLGQLVEYVIRTTIQEDNSSKSVEGWQE